MSPALRNCILPTLLVFIGDMEALASLPTKVYTPPFLHQEQYDDIEEFLDDVSDWLSDEYGWCHFGFETETDDGGIIKCDTLPE